MSRTICPTSHVVYCLAGTAHHFKGLSARCLRLNRYAGGHLALYLHVPPRALGTMANNKTNKKADFFIFPVAAIGLAALALGIVPIDPKDPVRFGCYCFLAILASGLRVSLPAITGTLSINFLFILIGLVQLGLPETLLMGATMTLVQCLRPGSGKKPSIRQVLFNVATVGIAILSADGIYSNPYLHLHGIVGPIALIAASVPLFFFTTIPVAIVIGLTERKKLNEVWNECYFWSFPYYIAGALIAVVFTNVTDWISWQVSLVVLPVMYLVYRSYRIYLGRLDDGRAHTEQMASLHLRTIEALAMAIEAKDTTTHDHLQRVQVYALEIGAELGLNNEELEALRAASLLHDIGKLAVPEHIISKPGKLTPEEFEKMKIHPVVGAEILERVQFPYPVAPIVRSHHEKWDGTGYPDGLIGEQIPIGARILSVVDCLDAMATDRQYRRALPLDQAMSVISKEKGQAFDPRVVEILERRYQELERMASSIRVDKIKLSTHVKIERGLAPAAGFENSGPGEVKKPQENNEAAPFLASIAAARQEVQALFELSQNLGNSLSLDETLSVLSVRLKKMVPFDTMCIFVKREDILVAEYVTGDNFRLFSVLEIPVGQGLSGWVAENRKSIINGNPSVEPGYLNDPTKFSTMRAALSVPLEGANSLVGVLSLYHGERDVFTRDHLRILQSIAPKLAQSMENALKFKQVEASATTDHLTGLPNSRSLSLHLETELARCRRLGLQLQVLVCDLDGFKMVNDRYGHLEGNRVLKSVADKLRINCREYDYVARMGGDEFVIVMPGSRGGPPQARQLHLAQLAGQASREVFGDECLSMSVGEAYYPQDGHSPEALIAQADKRMYLCKQNSPFRRKRGLTSRDPRKKEIEGVLQAQAQ